MKEVNDEKDPWECVGMAWKMQGEELNLQDTQVYLSSKPGPCGDRCKVKALMPVNMGLGSGMQQ